MKRTLLWFFVPVLVLVFSFCLPYTLHVTPYTVCWAEDAVCEFSKTPDTIEEGKQFEVTAKFGIPEGSASINCEMKDPEHGVLKAYKEKVSGKGEKKFKFVAPKLSEKEALIMAVWLGEDWQNPLAPIVFTDQIPIVKASAAQASDKKSESAEISVKKDAGSQVEKSVSSENQSPSVLISVEKGRKGSIAILKEKFRDADMSFPDAMAKELRGSGFGVTFLDGEQLSDKSILSTDNFFLLLLPHSKVFPANAQLPLMSFLKTGGSMLCFEGPPFRDTAWKQADPKGGVKWMTRPELEEYLSSSPDRTVLFNFEDGVDGWVHSSNGSQSAIEAEGTGCGGTKQSARVDVEDLQGWDCYFQQIDNPFPPGCNIISFWAKGDEKTKQLLVEWTEEDKSRWFAIINLETKWKFFMLSPKDFKYWPDNPSKGRGGARDVLKPENAAQLMIGLAFGQTNAVEAGPHTFWIDEIGAMKNPFQLAGPEIEMELEAMTPLYKHYQLKDITGYAVEPEQAFIKPDLKFNPPQQSWSCVHRPRGVGFQQSMKTRWVPLIYAKDKSGETRGTLAYLYISHSGKYNRSLWGAFSIPKEEFLKNPALMSALTGVIDRIRDGAYILKAGSKEFSVFTDETSVKISALIGNFSQEEKNVTARISVFPKKSTTAVFKQEQAMKIPAGEKDSLETVWEVDRFSAEAYDIRTELLESGKVIDVLVQELGILPWTPDSKKEFVTAKDGDFYLRGQKWYPFGVNYWPLYISGMSRDEYWSHWLTYGNYDPELVEPDLRQLKEWGVTALSISAGDRNSIRNALDFMRRCGKYGMHVNCYIGESYQVIKFARLDLNDVLFAYDVAWEPVWGTYNGGYGNQAGRKGFEKQWKDWVIEKYGGVENAEKDWGISVSQGSRLPAPSDKEMDSEGEHLRYICSYRRFVDDFLCRKYWDINRKIKDIDPNHLVSFRMNVAGDVGVPSSSFSYDFRGIAKAVDMLCPEGYGLNGGDWEKVKGGLFTVTYARYAAPILPVIWAEFGMSIWTGSTFDYDQGLMEKQGGLWTDILRMMYESGANGGFGWWYPGGYRVDEKSDYGIAPPDRNLRPAGKAIMQNSSKITASREIPKPVKWFEFDRDKYCRGYKAFYEEIKDEYFSSMKSGKVCGFRTQGTGTNSLNTPLIAVGNVEYNGTNPPKYLNAMFMRFKIKTADGWKEVENGKRYTVKANEPVLASAVIGNNGEAGWIAPSNAKGAKGGVFLVSTTNSQIKIKIEIKADVPYLADAVLSDFVLSSPPGLPANLAGRAGEDRGEGTVAAGFSPRVVELEMSADGRCAFGERLRFTVIAEQ
ncbi:hypothetical protein COY52_02720 [Candidatus Desantisbacteria bacterium CG_4_10_14_0_8_um_filter_48_22]|uniref:Glycoside hydrolase family 42 N-terminal domain-containing protein n=1 Tax=Candidatus Desantisbacteria bacterium CG_4_10_14_0_8_um_filter_48_22 TaxID=1974543 RepID=A0A2M7SE81_9BACT|nr:MAG: hypothetical protein AUJ67_02030 [Candidatus Desantisbacteria bacterium CG1_02_49_89]PIZ17799.1 MAG: hypothetical protein COY52_02720 [Candidatus Desantisbacteria bacterium CG_4_10_14_0_8_um_filter_48_22]